VLSRTSGIAGFFGASSIERLATEEAIVARARQFRSIVVRNERPSEEG
jgi:predicted TIM-barrel enzyme